MRWMWVLVSLLDNIAANLDAVDTAALCECNKVLRSVGRTRERPTLSGNWSILDKVSVEIVHVLCALDCFRRRGRRKSKAATFQLKVLAHELALIGLGVRASYLVDVMLIAPEHIPIILKTVMETEKWRSVGLETIIGGELAGNVFIMNPRAMILQSAKALIHPADLTVIDVHSCLDGPRKLAPDDQKYLSEVCQTIVGLCQKMISAEADVVMDLNASTIHRIAMAGVILGYPIIYTLIGDGNVADRSEWQGEENCLGMCPLLVFDSSFRTGDIREPVIRLHQFSVPRLIAPQSHDQARIKALMHQKVAEMLQTAGVDLSTIAIDIGCTTARLPLVGL